MNPNQVSWLVLDILLMLVGLTNGIGIGLLNLFPRCVSGGLESPFDVYPHGYTPRNTPLKRERDKREEKWKLCKVKTR